MQRKRNRGKGESSESSTAAAHERQKREAAKSSQPIPSLLNPPRRKMQKVANLESDAIESEDESSSTFTPSFVQRRTSRGGGKSSAKGYETIYFLSSLDRLS